MATAAVATPHDVTTTVNYYKPIGTEAPYNYTYDPPAGVERSNVGVDEREVVIHDVRGKEDTVGLDKTGFQFVKHISNEKDFVDEKKVEAEYYKEVEALLKQQTGAKRVFIFDHTIRRPKTGKESSMARSAVLRAHVDQTFVAAKARVYHHLGEDADRLLKGRYRIINVWRPIQNPVAHHPLAVADYYSLSSHSDLVSTRHIYPDREGSTFAIKYSPDLKWYYLSGQTPEEVTLIKCFDSDEGKARLTPHTAFVDKTSPKDAPDRQSIEVRALVFDEE